MSLIGISGHMGVGKDTVGQMIQTEARGYWEIKKYAKKLKQITCILTGCSMQELESQEFKNSLLSPEWKGGHCTFSHSTYRDILQKLGTEVMRDSLHSNVWVNALYADYTPIGLHNKDYVGPMSIRKPKSDSVYPNWVITDMRFPNELEAVKEHGGITIRVVRYPKTLEQSRGFENVETISFDPTNERHMDLWKGEYSRMHISETALDNANFDYTIHNDGDLSDLKASVVEFLRKTNLR
jgi:hypothetical protein